MNEQRNGHKILINVRDFLHQSTNINLRFAEAF